MCDREVKIFTDGLVYEKSLTWDEVFAKWKDDEGKWSIQGVG